MWLAWVSLGRDWRSVLSAFWGSWKKEVPSGSHSGSQFPKPTTDCGISWVIVIAIPKVSLFQLQSLEDILSHYWLFLIPQKLYPAALYPIPTLTWYQYLFPSWLSHGVEYQRIYCMRPLSFLRPLVFFTINNSKYAIGHAMFWSKYWVVSTIGG